MSFSIILPSRTIDNLRPAVACIRAAHEKARIIVVDDFDEDGPRVELPEALGYPDCTWIKGVKPFVFARNINLGIAAAGDDDVILLNDDACLKSPMGFSLLATIAKENPEYGIISAGITAAVGNEEQLALPGTRLREAKFHTIVFVCVYIRRAVLNLIQRPGVEQWLDEDYTAYGHEDNQACAEVRKMELKLGVFDGCVVEHGILPSTFRGFASVDISEGMRTFVRKWGCTPAQLKFPHELRLPKTGAPIKF